MVGELVGRGGDHLDVTEKNVNTRRVVDREMYVRTDVNDGRGT